MKKYTGLALLVFTLSLLIIYTTSDNEKLGNALWLYYLLIGLLVLLIIPLTPNKKYAKDRKKDKIPYSWVLSVITIVLHAANGWFFIAILLATGTISLKLKEAIGNDELKQTESPAG